MSGHKRKNTARTISLLYRVTQKRQKYLAAKMERREARKEPFSVPNSVGSQMNPESPNERFQDIYGQIGEMRDSVEEGTQKKLELNLKIKEVFEDLDRNIKDIAATIIAERYQKNVRFKKI